MLMIQKIFSILALLLVAVSGAWAQTETLLTTITPTAKEQASYSTANVATVSFSYTADGSSAYLANWGWWGYGWSATVNAAEGYTITKCIFYDDADRKATDSEAPFVVETTDGDKTPRINGTPIDGGNMWSKGIKKIEVYGYVTPAATTYSVTLAEGTEDSDNWTIEPAKAAEGSPVTVTYSGEKKVKSVKAVKKGGAPDPQAVPLTIEAITPGIISISKPKEGMQYSLNGGAKTAATTSIDVAAGDKVQFYGNGTSITKYQGTIITGSGNGFTCKVYGNIMSLVDETGLATATTLSGNYTFYRLFYGNTTLTDASGLLLPATELAPDCYDQMFMGCTALTAAPALPATTLVEKCYYRMFYNCTALTAAPELPATKLAAECYNQMFSRCTSLTAAPELPATTLVEYCYYQMFSSCTSLTTAPVLPATTLVDHCYYGMFDGCSKLATVTSLAESGINTESSTTNWLKNTGTQAQGTKIVYTVSTADWPTGNNGIPAGWTRVNVDN